MLSLAPRTDWTASSTSTEGSSSFDFCSSSIYCFFCLVFLVNCLSSCYLDFIFWSNSDSISSSFSYFYCFLGVYSFLWDFLEGIYSVSFSFFYDGSVSVTSFSVSKKMIMTHFSPLPMIYWTTTRKNLKIKHWSRLKLCKWTIY